MSFYYVDFYYVECFLSLISLTFFMHFMSSWHIVPVSLIHVCTRGSCGEDVCFRCSKCNRIWL